MQGHSIIRGDCLEIMQGMDDNSVDLVVTSPPYESARTYGIDYKLRGEEWVKWAFDRYMECLRVCRGAVCWVVAGNTGSKAGLPAYKWSAAPALLTADLHRAGVNLRNPLLYKRHGIPGSGGPDWFANKCEWIICATPPGRLPWSDNTAMGHPPKCPVGGAMSNRHQDGRRLNENSRFNRKGYKQPARANPGNIIDCGAVGGGNMGSPIASLNEAPFPEKIPEFLIRSLCPPDGVVLDIFAGSGTTAKVAGKFGRRSISVDIRESQTALVRDRLGEIKETA